MRGALLAALAAAAPGAGCDWGSACCRAAQGPAWRAAESAAPPLAFLELTAGPASAAAAQLLRDARRFRADVRASTRRTGGHAGRAAARSPRRTMRGDRELPTKNATPPSDPPARCNATLLTTYFTTLGDWQRSGRRTPAAFWRMHAYYESVVAQRGAVQAVVLHDGLPEDMVRRYTRQSGGRVRFERVDVQRFADLGVDDVRFPVFREQLEQHPEWDVVFVTDLFDVTVHRNPCDVVMEHGREKLYIGSEDTPLKAEGGAGAWFRGRFHDMGGKYEQWYDAQPTPSGQIFNSGVEGGARGVLLRFLERVTAVLDDPQLAARQEQKTVNVDMSALNWVLHTEYNASAIFTGAPLNSRFRQYEENRTDVAFVHKF